MQIDPGKRKRRLLKRSEISDAMKLMYPGDVRKHSKRRSRNLFYAGMCGMRAGQNNGLTPATRAFFKQDEIGVQVVRKRNRKKQKDERGHRRSPLVQRFTPPGTPRRPAHTPDAESEDGNQHPEKVEE